MDTEKLAEAFTVAITAAIEEMGWENFKQLEWFKYDNPKYNEVDNDGPMV